MLTGRRSDARLKAMLPSSASSRQTVEFSSTPRLPSYTIQIFRKLVQRPRRSTNFVCASQSGFPTRTGPVNATGRSPVSSVRVDWRSGVYLAKPEESVGYSQWHVIFVVKDKTTMPMSCSNFPSTHIKRIISGRPVRLCVGQRRRTSVGLHPGGRLSWSLSTDPSREQQSGRRVRNGRRRVLV